MWHRFVRWVGRRSLGWFFRDVVIADADRIPAEGPVIIIANHPNDLPDVLIGYLSTPREVHFIATISAATNPLSRATYRGLGVIPVTRVRDARKLLEKGASIANLNRVAYRRVVQALRDRRLIGVFPEGGVNTEWSLRHLKPGVAQMVLQCFDDAGCASVTIVPLGLQYEEPDRPWSDCLARVGRPLVVDSSAVLRGEWKVQNLTTMLFQRLAEVTRHGPTASERAIMDQTAAVIGASLSNRAQDGLLLAGSVAPHLTGPDASQHPIMSDNAVGDDVRILCERVEQASGRSRVAGDHALLHEIAVRRTGSDTASNPRLPEVSRTSSRRWSWPASWLRDGDPVLLILSAPVAAFGWIIHAPLFSIIWKHALATAESRAHRAGRAHLPGLYIVLGWYVFIASLAAVLLSQLGISPWFSVLLFMLLFRLGDLSVQWRHGLVTMRLRNRASAFSDAQLRDTLNRYQRVRDTWDRLQKASSSSAPVGEVSA